MDILPTADGTPVVFHDLNMKRATGLDADIRQVLAHSFSCTMHCVQCSSGCINDGHQGCKGSIGSSSRQE